MLYSEIRLMPSSNVLKAFITEHEDDVMIWTQSSLMLCGWLLVKSSDSVKLTRQFKEASISAIGMLSTNAQEKDVLFLSPQHRLTLWSRRFGLVNIKLADNFLPNADASTTVLKRRRSSLGASSLPSSGFVSPSRGSRLVQLRDSASNRVTLCLSNNALFRVTIDLRPKSSLGKRCFLALKDSIGLDKEKAIANRFWNLRHSKDSRLDSLRQNGEFLDFSVTLLSFYGWTATIPEETPTSSPWEAMNNAAQRLGLFEKLPDCVIQALDINKETKSNTGIRQMLSVAKKLRDTLMNPVEFVIEDWCLLSTVFHEVYESLKLSILSQSAARELGELLCILACVTGRKQYSTYYRFDGLVHDAFIPGLIFLL